MRRTASTDLIARGIGYVQIPDIETCRKFAEGRFTAQDVVDLVLRENNGRAGVWWGSIGDNEWDYYDDEYAPFHHAYYSSNSDPMTIVAEYDEAAEEYGDQVFYSEKADIGVVLYAEHPYVNGTYWNPLTDNQPIPGHQSQSYVPEGTQLRLVKVGVEHAGLVDEIYLPANGMTVTAALGGQGITVTAAGKCEYCKEQATQKIIHSEGMAYIPVCDSHLSKGKDDAAACVPYGDPDPSNVDRVEKISAYYTEDELRALGEQAMAEDPRLRQLAEQWEARQAGWENDFDEIVDLLGGPLRPAEPWVAPERPHFDPIPGVEPGWEEYALDLLGRPDRTGEADLWLPTEAAWYYREYDRSGNSGQASAVEYVLRQEGIRSPVTVSTDGRQALMIEGNHRVMIARRLGIAQIPVRIQWDPNGVRANEGTPKPLEPVLEDWLRQRGRIARTAAAPQMLYRGINLTTMPDYDDVFEQAVRGDLAGALQRTLDYMRANNLDPTLGIGRHWSTDKKVARDYSKGPFGLNVFMAGYWDGNGEDLERTNTYGDWDDEEEITLLPGTPVQLTSLTINLRYMGSPGPIELLTSGGITVTAAEPGGVLPYPASDFGYLWDRLDPETYAAVTRDGISEMTLWFGAPGGQVQWTVEDDLGIVERGYISGADPDQIFDRANRLISEFDTNPAIPSKSDGYDGSYTETFPTHDPAPDFREPGVYR